MERREAPGRCATAPFGGPLRSGRRAPCEGARTLVIGCCASRRSIPGARCRRTGPGL